MVMYAATPMTLVELLRYRAQEPAQQPAYIFLADGEREGAQWTYRDLDQHARMIGALLHSHHAAGERVLLLYPPGLDYIAAFFGCLYAGAIAVPAYPPRNLRHLPRIQTIATDAQARFILTAEKTDAKIRTWLTQMPGASAMQILVTDTLEDDLATQWQTPHVTGQDLAFLQYTSGSTALPKGVMVNHDNLLHNLGVIQQAFECTPASRGVSWLPPYHDMGLIGGILLPLFVGFPVTLMTPTAFLQRPVRWLQAMTTYQATISAAPNFAYDLCAHQISAEQRPSLDLSDWDLAVNGAEPIQHQTLEDFAVAFAGSGFRREAFYPCYGLAEATLFVAGGTKLHGHVSRAFQIAALEQGCVQPAPEQSEHDRALVGCGGNVRNQTLAIVHPETRRRCAPDQIGEIWLAGPSVTLGYWNNPEATDASFHAYLTDTGAGPFLRTGDLGFLHEGELFIAGRLKDVLIIRGRNHYPQDIELTVEHSHAAIRRNCSAAFAVEVVGEERLVIVAEVERRMTAPLRRPENDRADARNHRKRLEELEEEILEGFNPTLMRSFDISEVITTIRQAVSEQHDIQAYGILLLKVGTIPRTSSGKIQRHACKQGFFNQTLEVVGRDVLAMPAPQVDAAPATVALALSRAALRDLPPAERQARVETYLRHLTAALVHLPVDQIDPRQPLSAFGLDSLMATELQYRLETGLGLAWPMTKFLEGPAIVQLAQDACLECSAEACTSNAGTPLPAIVPQPLTDHALSYNQQSLWFMYQLAPESAAYNVFFGVRLRSAVDLAALQRAFDALFKRHPALRTTYCLQDGKPGQHIHDQAQAAFTIRDASTWPAEQFTAHVLEECHRPFDLEQGPVLRVHVFKRAVDEHVLLLNMHHLATDLWSFSVITKELGVLYDAEHASRPHGLPPLSLSYTDYVRWQANLLAGAEGDRLWSYWKQQLQGDLPALNLPTDHPRPPVQTYRGASYVFTLDAALTHQIKALAAESGATLFMTLLAAFNVLLYRYTSQEDILVGSPSASRSRPEFENIVGYFVNPVVIRSDISGNPTFKSFLSQVRQTVLAALAHQDFPFSLLVERLQPQRDPARSPLFQVLFVLQKPYRLELPAPFIMQTAGGQMKLGALDAIESVALDHRIAQFDLTLVMTESDGALSARLEYNTDLFEADTIRRMAGHFQTLLTGITSNPDHPVATLPLLPLAEQQQLLVEWNNTSVEYPRHKCLHELFEEQVNRTPDAVAVVFEDQQMTYQELNIRANQLAYDLIKQGVRPDVLVGIYMERSLEMIVGLLGVLKAGGAYVPLDPDYPKERLVFMLEDAQAAVVLTQDKFVNEIPGHEARVVCLNLSQTTIATENTTNPIIEINPDNLAYVIYTSGSTGRPKGVMIPHSAICNHMHWMQTTFPLSEHDKVLQKTPFSFDASIWEFYAPLIAGAQLVMARPGGHLDTSYLLRVIAEQKITTLQLVPSLLRMLVSAKGIDQCTSLKRLFCGGEILPLELVAPFFKKNPVVSVYNLYGPTEATIDTVFWKCEPVNKQIAPIGRPVFNTQLYIVDSYLQPVPIGATGELHIGGDSIGRGYLNRPELTHEKFIVNPFSAEPGAHLYKTGDLARYLADGTIEFLGRIDHQVKIRGFRIELGEIEAVLSKYAGVKQAIVIDREDQPGDKRLIAYLSLYPDAAVTAGKLRHFLKETLPEYMLPSAFVILENIPLTPNGKVDRKMLPAPDQSVRQTESAFLAPRNTIEQTIAKIWQEVLNLKKVGVHDNFFDLGGHSLLIIQVQAQLEARFKRAIPVVDLFKYPTIAALAQALSAKSDAVPSALQQVQDRASKQRAAFKRQQHIQHHKGV